MTIPQMAALARDHWKKTNPEVFRKMVKNKDLEKESVAAAELTLMEMKTLIGKNNQAGNLRSNSIDPRVKPPEIDLRLRVC